jgi:hypothetical protein
VLVHLGEDVLVKIWPVADPPQPIPGENALVGGLAAAPLGSTHEGDVTNQFFVVETHQGPYVVQVRSFADAATSNADLLDRLLAGVRWD